MLKVLEEDFARIPGLLERSHAETVEPEEAPPALVEDPDSVQLGLF
jgi:hypothetical protein